MKVLLTHGEGRLEGLAQALRAYGFTVARQPLIRTEFLPFDEAQQEADKLRGAAWLLFTSRTAVQAWAALGLPLTAYIGVVGEKTADAVKQSGGMVALTANPANAEGLLEAFLACVSPPARVGLPCGERALPTLSNGLNAAGFTVMKAVLYCIVTRPLTRVDADLIVLASPSAVAALPANLGQTQLVALGPSTHKAVRARGWHAAEAQTPDVYGVVQAVLEATSLTT